MATTQGDSVRAEMERLAADGMGANRVFLGSRDRNALLVLSDTKGRPRIRLVVDPQDEARLEFLDAEGGVVTTLPR